MRYLFFLILFSFVISEAYADARNSDETNFALKSLKSAGAACSELLDKASLIVKQFRTPNVYELHVLTSELAQDPSNEFLQEKFIERSHELCNQYRNFKKVGAAYDRILAAQKGELTFERLQLIVRFLKNSYDGLRHYPYQDSAATGSVQKYFSDLIVRELKTNPSFTVMAALNLVQQLQEADIRFEITPQYPMDYFERRWILGEILRAGILAGKDIRTVEDAIIASVNDKKLVVRLNILSRVDRYVRYYRVTDRVRQALRNNFAVWVRRRANFANSDRAIEETKKIVDVGFLSQHAKRVITYQEFLTEANDKKPRGVLFGDLAGGEPYSAVQEFTELMEFSSAYHRVLMTTNMERLEREGQLRKSREFMRRLMFMGWGIVFLLPTDINETFYTKSEYDFLIEDPRRLMRVTFVLGAYGDREKKK